MGDIDDCYEDGLINQNEFKELDKLLGQTDYLINKVIKGLRNKIDRQK